MRHYNDKVLVEEVDNDLSVSNVVYSSMMEEKSPEISKFTKCKVCRL